MKKRQSLLCRLSDIRLLWTKYKVYFIAAGVCIVIGLMLSLKGIKQYANEKNTLSLVAYIAAGDYPFMKVFLLTILLPCLLCLSIFLLSCNYYSIFLYYLELIILNKLIFCKTLASFIFNFFYGLLSAVFFVLPILLFDIFLLTLFWADIYEIIPYPCPKKIFHIVPYRCYISHAKHKCIRTILTILIFNALTALICSLLFWILFCRT